MSVFLEILRCILCCPESDRERDYETSERDPLFGMPCYNTSVRSSSPSNHDLLHQSDPNRIYYYERYPNVSISESTTNTLSFKPSLSYNTSPSSPKSHESLPKLGQFSNSSLSSFEPYLPFSSSTTSYKPSCSPQKASQSLTQSSSASYKSYLSATGPSASSSSPASSSPKLAFPSSEAPASFSSSASSSRGQSLASPDAPPFTFDQPRAPAKPSASSLKPSPSLCGSSQSPTLLTPSSLKASESYKPTPSRLFFDSTIQQKNVSYIWVQKEKSPNYMPGEDIKNLTKKGAVHDISKKPLSPSSLKPPPSSKLTLAPLSSDSTIQQTEANYEWVQKDKSHVYIIPKDIEILIQKDIVPDVLKKPLSRSTYKNYFAALLYAEDFYYEKWHDYKLFNVTLELQRAAIHDKSPKSKKWKESDEKDKKIFVAFEMDSVPEKRPFLLSRDFVFARCSDSSREFQGIIYRVVKSTTALVEFEKDFYSQHRSSRKYDISFSFNRVCLKRAHQAIAAASDPLFQNYLFPECASRKFIPSSEPFLYDHCTLDWDNNFAARRIVSFKGQPPYLVEGPLCVTKHKTELEDETETEFVLSKTGIVVREAVLQIYQSLPDSRVLICAPSNRTLDVVAESLMEHILEPDMFRANAAFREVDGVPDDIFPLCLYEGECFSCPSLEELRKYRVIFSTFVSSFRLHNEGITAGHFSHIFLVDTSSAIEPETVIVLSHLADENTAVIATGARKDHPRWVRSDMARWKGLRQSYFERLLLTETYKGDDPEFITQLLNTSEESK